MSSITQATGAAISVLLVLGITRPAAAQSANPACALLTTEEIRHATGSSYADGSAGDEPGEGLGGGSSCQWSSPGFAPGERLPMLGLVLIPPAGQRGFTQSTLATEPRATCTRETVRGVGDMGFLESCARERGLKAYVKAGRYDVVVIMDSAPGAAASVKGAVLAVARAAAAKAKALE